MPIKIVLNVCYGGFTLSAAGETKYREYAQTAPDFEFPDHIDALRACPHLVRVVEELGDDAGSDHSRLCVIEIPDDAAVRGWVIKEYDGKEWVAETHRTWAGPRGPKAR